MERENIIKLIRLIVKNIHKYKSLRPHGALEVLLMGLGKIEIGGDIAYGQVEYDAGWFRKKIKTRRETYRECIMRLAQEVLEEEEKNNK